MTEYPEPPDGTRIEFQEHGSPGGDLIAIYRHDASSLEAGYPVGDGGVVWCEYGRSVPMTWDKILRDPRLRPAVDGVRLVPVTERIVVGYCPMGCGDTLFLGSGGYLTCSSTRCPRPDAASDLLRDPEVHHVVDIKEHTFTVRHPLQERLDDVLMTCTLHLWLTELEGPPRKPGRYRVVTSAMEPWAKASWVELSDGGM